MKCAFLFFAIMLSVFFAACGGSSPNTAANNSVANKTTSPTSTPLPPDVNLPTPSANANNAPTPTDIPVGPSTRGIPTKEQQKKAGKAGPTPTPGIPSPEEIRRQMGTPRSPNDAPPGNSPPMMKSQPMMKTTKTPHPTN